MEPLAMQYFAENAVRKLHLGVGGNYLGWNDPRPAGRANKRGWLDTDVTPRSPHILQLDATKRFPFDDGTFDYVFSEHMIEHIRYPEGVVMLQESFRVLKPGGKVRVSTPDLQFLIDMLNPNRTPLQQQYLEHIYRNSDRRDMPVCDPIFLFNYFVRMGGENGGHVFIWNVSTLANTLQACGFRNITQHRVCESDDPELLNLEAVGRLPPGMLQMETFTLQATKP